MSGGATGAARCACASCSHHEGRDGNGGVRLRGRTRRLYGLPFAPTGNDARVRVMFAIYSLAIVAGLALWIGVALVVD